MYFPVDGPAVYKQLTVTDTAVQAIVGGTPLDERKVIQIQAIDAEVWYGYDNMVTDTTGFKIFRGQTVFVEAGPSLLVYLVAPSGESVDVRIAELA